MFGLFFIGLLLLQTTLFAQNACPPTPDKLYGELFVDVQLQRIFQDSKIFVDCNPLSAPTEIIQKYRQQKSKAGFSLKKFVLENFKLPQPPSSYSGTQKDVVKHIHELWKVLQRKADVPVSGSSLLPLPYSYIVPGGRFREIYYWDTYFTMLGLKESKQYALMENMVNNFAHLLNQFHHIPNGNRTYYLSRSQPPFFSLMVEQLAAMKGQKVYTQYRQPLEIEMKYWNDISAEQLNRRQVVIKDREGKENIFSRYDDELFIPRQESYAEDHATGIEAVSGFTSNVKFTDSTALIRATENIYALTCNNLRTAAASGWDFSSRWMSGDKLYTTRAGEIIPVDLNCLVAHLQASVVKAQMIQKSGKADTTSLNLLVQYRKKIYRQIFFNEEIGWYCDYDTVTRRVMNNPSLAGMFPLFLKLAEEKDVPRIVAFLKKHFLKKGGVVTTLNSTGQQWDAPNGWAPLQWITIIGLENYGYHQLAKEIATRWVSLNKKVFKATGKLMEKYDVINIDRTAGGGEYPGQDGFGWTNGVLLALINKYKL